MNDATLLELTRQPLSPPTPAARLKRARKTARWVMIVAMLLASPVLAEDGPAEDGATDPPAEKVTRGNGGGSTRSKAIADAVEKLTEEYRDSAKTTSFNTLRTSSEYFTEPPADATPAALLAALEKSVGSDRRLNAYVKWQLLSAMTEPFADDLAARAVRLYGKAPALSSRPGATPAGKAELARLVATAKLYEVTGINSKYDDLIKRNEEANQPIVGYRDELFKRLPPGIATFEAALKDGQERVSAGVDTATFWSNVETAIAAWMESGKGSARDYKRLADQLEKVAEQPGVEHPAKAVWDDKQKKAVWKSTTVTLATPDQLYGTINSLRAKAGLEPVEPVEPKEPRQKKGDSLNRSQKTTH